MSNKQIITVDEFQAREILKSKDQMVPVLTETGLWTGQTVNKAFIVSTSVNDDETERFKSKFELIKAGLDGKDPTTLLSGQEDTKLLTWYISWDKYIKDKTKSLKIYDNKR